MRLLSRALLCALLSLSVPARADMAGDCVQSRDPALSERACTVLIDGGTLSGDNLVTAYYNRGNARNRLRKFEASIADYSRALELDPNDGSSWFNRGISRHALGRAEAALGDWETSARVDGAPRVKIYQNFLSERGLYSGPVDGVFNDATRRALAACAHDPKC